MCKKEKLADLNSELLTCKKCSLCPNTVPGNGSSESSIMFVGEAPGETEALLQKPFVGLCGQLFETMLINSNIKRNETYITNVVKGRPTSKTRYNKLKNRPPTDDEIKLCKMWLWKEIQIIQPIVIVTLGRVSTYTLLHSQLRKTFSLGNIIGKRYIVDYCKSFIVPLYHPSYLMQHAKDKIEDCINILHDLKEEILT